MKTYKVNKGFIVQKLDNKTVIFDGEESVLYTFNETASVIFKRIKSGWDEVKIIDELAKKYDIKKKRVEKDVDRIFSEMIKKKIISFVKSKK